LQKALPFRVQPWLEREARDSWPSLRGGLIGNVAESFDKQAKQKEMASVRYDNFS
jgi:hypothetical protein